MRPLTSLELVEFWEQGGSRSTAYWAVALLDAANDDDPGAAAIDLTVGERDRRLMLLRCWLYGPQVNGIASCAGCSELLEITFDLHELMASADEAVGGPVTVHWKGTTLSCRAPTTADILAAAADDRADIRRGLLARCITIAGDTGQRTASADPLAALPASALAKVSAALSAADPLADVRLTVTCHECGHRWDTAFDIASFLWTEISASVERILGEVHVLASAYGWSEAEVLAAGPRRRQYYLEAVGG
jgi:hypothetical protein